MHIANRREAVERLFAKHGKPEWMNDTEKYGFIEWLPNQVSRKKEGVGAYFIEIAVAAASSQQMFSKRLKHDMQNMPKFEMTL
jgi:hypothetical protein